MSNLSETKNINHLMFWDWHPAIMYNHHQTGPAGTVMFSPPFRDPFNYNFDPHDRDRARLGRRGDASALRSRRTSRASRCARARTTRRGGTAVCARSATSRASSAFSPSRSATRRRSESRSSPSISCRTATLPAPIAPRRWHFRQSIDYSVSANYAIFDFASRYRETLLYDKYLMAKHAIEKGNKDSWTVSGKDVAAAQVALTRARSTGAQQAGAPGGGAADVAAWWRGGGRSRRDDAGGGFGRGGGERRGADARLQRRAPREGQARSARVHHSRRSAGFPHGGQVREHAPPRRRLRRSGDGAVLRGRQAVSRRTRSSSRRRKPRARTCST